MMGSKPPLPERLTTICERMQAEGGHDDDVLDVVLARDAVETLDGIMAAIRGNYTDRFGIELAGRMVEVIVPPPPPPGWRLADWVDA